MGTATKQRGELREIAKKINAKHDAILQRGRRDIPDACEIGSMLNAVAAGFEKSNRGKRRGRDGWQSIKKWVSGNCNFVFSTAALYMGIAKKVAEGLRIDPTWTLTDAYVHAGLLSRSDSQTENNESKPDPIDDPDPDDDPDDPEKYDGPTVIKKSSSGGFECLVRWSKEEDNDLMALLDDVRLGSYLKAGLVLKLREGEK